MRGLPAADRPGRARRRGRRQHAGARPRARLGRVRRAVREPDARARLAGRARGTRHEASVYAAAGSRPARGGRESDTSQLEGMPVVCCSVHSQVVPVFAALTGLRVAYVQLEGGALPLALSDAVRTLIASSALGRRVLRRRRRVRERVVGACLGEERGARRRRLLGRARHRRHRLPARPRWARRRYRRECRDRARRPGSSRGARLGGRRARAPPGPLAPHADRPRPLPGRGRRPRRDRR